MSEERFAGGIAPATLLAQVRSAAPWLDRRAAPTVARPSLIEPGAMAWLSALRAGGALAASARPDAGQRLDYAAVCLAAHHATVATYVPTDVDARIRGHAWHDEPDGEVRARLLDIALAMHGWDVRVVSRRWLDDGGRTLSGHDGEWLSVMTGAMGAALANGDALMAERCAAAIDGELTREAAAFARLRATPGAELDLLRACAVLTHNVGDIDQGLSHWRGASVDHAYARRFARLAHERPERHGRAFTRAAAVYRRVLAAEGHRNYPLREARALRADPDLLLPLAPLLDDWGAVVAMHPSLSDAARGEVLAALIVGTRKVRGQDGYHRAIAGFIAAGGLERVARALPAAARRQLDDADLRKRIAVPRASFESSLRKRLAQALVEAS